MHNERLFLRPNAAMEPLVDQWYAWSFLISPATAARNLTHRHLPIMDSYVRSPQVHAAAVKNPALRGGPFMDCAASRVGEVAALKEKTQTARANLVAFSRAIDQLDALLRTEGAGQSLEPFYARIPEPLQGYVELVYDLDNHPSFRLIEPLLYRSDYYVPASQSVWLSLLHGDHRPFMLSTPRLMDEGGIHLATAFSHDGLDQLFAMTRTPQTFAHIKDALGFADSLDDRFRELLTPAPPRPYAPYRGPDVRWRYFGHACVLVETSTCSILVDPLISYDYESDIPRYTYEDLPDEIDYVLITHNHQDHFVLESLLRLRHKIRHIVVPRSGHGALQDPSLRLLLENIGFTGVIELSELQELETSSGSIVGLPFLGEHGDLGVAAKMAWHVTAGGRRLLFAADSCNVSPAMYRHLHALLGDVDVLFLGMECDGAPVSWLYGALFSTALQRQKDHSRRLAGCDYEQALDLVRTFRCKEAYVYAMGQEPWLEFLMAKVYTYDSHPIAASNRLIEECRRHGIVAEGLFGAREVLL